MAALTAEQILAAPDLKRERVRVPEWGGEVYVRTVTAGDKETFEADILAETEGDPQKRRRFIRAGWVVLTTCDAEGRPLFAADDREALNSKGASAIDRIVNVAFRLNGVTGKDEDDLVKNSEPSPSDDSDIT